VLYNADGSRAEMSGNGIRCFAQALALRRGDLDPQTILTDAGDRRSACSPPTADTIEATVDMGEVADGPSPTAGLRSAATPTVRCCTSASGNPHSVVGVDEVAVVDLLSLGEQVPGT
jgi:diaminopimelate epimerase